MAAMVPCPCCHHTQQSANMMRNMSMLLKLEGIIVFTINMLCKGATHHQPVVSMFACCGGCQWPILAGKKLW
jgi:hypothetical protein